METIVQWKYLENSMHSSDGKVKFTGNFSM